MQIGSAYRTVRGWTRRAAARRRDRLASLTRLDERLMTIAQRARATGVPYDTWRRVLQPPNAGW
jgi:hypothetical protein